MCHSDSILHSLHFHLASKHAAENRFLQSYLFFGLQKLFRDLPFIQLKPRQTSILKLKMMMEMREQNSFYSFKTNMLIMDIISHYENSCTLSRKKRHLHAVY